jgi:hypothetical protein
MMLMSSRIVTMNRRRGVIISGVSSLFATDVQAFYPVPRIRSSPDHGRWKQGIVLAAPQLTML